MLTSDLVRVRVSRTTVVPQLLDPAAPDLLDLAAALLDAAADAAEARSPRGELTDTLAELAAAHKAPKLAKGLAKLVLDRCEAEIEAPLPPAALRARAFALAAARGPLALPDPSPSDNDDDDDDDPDANAHPSLPGRRDPLGRPTATTVLAELAAALADEGHPALSPGALADLLYADLPDAQAITAFAPLTPSELLHRYNLATVQAVLFKAVRLQLAIEAPSPGRLRQLLRHIKFRQLMHRAWRSGDTVHLDVEGPAAVLQQANRYGLALAHVLAAVPLLDVPWKLEADLLWGPRRAARQLRLDHTAGLVSHLADTGAHPSREAEALRTRWDHPTWRLSEAVVPLELGGRGVILPDFHLTDGTREAWLDIVGFWQRDWLARRVEGLKRHGVGHLILAVSRRLSAAAEALEGFDGAVISFAAVVPQAAVVEAAEAVAVPVGRGPRAEPA